MIDKKKALNFVKEYMHNTEAEGKHNKSYWRSDARNRFEHIKRVHRHAKTLCHFVEDIDPDVVEVAAIFHDVGKFVPGQEHEEVGAQIAREYLENEGVEAELVDKVANAVRNHMQWEKEGIDLFGFPMEDRVLMDADMIDETGIMAVTWIAMKEGREELSHERCLERLHKEIEHTKRCIKAANTQKAKEILIKNSLLVKGLAHTLEQEINGEMI